MAMSSTGPAILAGLASAREQVKTTDFFALCHLMLCMLSYTAEADGRAAVDLIAKSLPRMPVPQQGTAPGKWSLGWGPQVTPGNGNLMFAAEFIAVGADPPAPVFSAVVIRGTDVESKPSGILAQIIEDCRADQQVTFPDGNLAGAKIAAGTMDGLAKLTGLLDPGPDAGKTITEYVKGFVGRNPGAPIVVTGHSLGGCQATVLALHLGAALLSSTPPLKATIVPTTFAAPTAGNPAFVQLYEQTFPYCPRWFNTLDLVPNAYASLEGIRQLWSGCERPAPLLVKMALKGFELALNAVNAVYAQPGRDSRPVTAKCQPEGVSAIPAYMRDQTVREVEAVLQSAIANTHGVLGLIEKLTLAAPFDWIEELLYQHLIMTGYWDVVKAARGVAPIPAPEMFLRAAAAGAGAEP